MAWRLLVGFSVVVVAGVAVWASGTTGRGSGSLVLGVAAGLTTGRRWRRRR